MMATDHRILTFLSTEHLELILKWFFYIISTFDFENLLDLLKYCKLCVGTFYLEGKITEKIYSKIPLNSLENKNPLYLYVFILK